MTRSERAQSLPIIILMMFVLIGFMGMAIDVGYALLQKRRLQAAVDLALISGARDLPNAGTARATADDIARENFRRTSPQTVSTTTSTSCMQAGCAHDDRIFLRANSSTPTFFVKLFGIDSWPISAQGAACGPCDSSAVAFDVVVVLDRSYSMCLDASNRENGCYDLDQAKDGVRELLQFFDPKVDRLSLAVLSSADTASCSSGASCPASNAAGRPYSHTRPGPSYTWVTANSSPAPCDSANPADVSGGRYARSLGDFMDSTSGGGHDAWVVVPLSQGTNFKNANGSINSSSAFVSTLECLEHKYWTPIAPAIDEARRELVSNGRSDTQHIIVYLGDGGATAQPMRRNSDGSASTTASWYTPSSGNNNRPCHDAVGQAAKAKAAGIIVYTIGYAVGQGSAATCTNNSGAVESGITAKETLRQMATDDDHFYDQPSPGSVEAIFREVGHSIIVGGTRLVE